MKQDIQAKKEMAMLAALRELNRKREEETASQAKQTTTRP